MRGFHSGANLFQVAPPSVVWNEPFVSDTEARRASTATTVRMSSCTGARSFCQCAPASVVRRIVPLLPTIQQTLSVGAEPPSRSVVTGPACRVHVFPALEEISMTPACPARQNTSPPGAAMVTSPTLLARRIFALSLNLDMPAISCCGVTPPDTPADSLATCERAADCGTEAVGAAPAIAPRGGAGEDC